MKRPSENEWYAVALAWLLTFEDTRDPRELDYDEREECDAAMGRGESA